MAPVRDCATAILREYHRAEEELVGRAVVLTDGKAGTVVTPDEAHGLRLSVENRLWTAYPTDGSVTGAAGAHALARAVGHASFPALLGLWSCSRSFAEG